MLKQLVDQLGRDLDMQDLITQEEKNEYILPFDENIQVEAIQRNHSILLKGTIGECPKQHPDAFLLRTIEANLFGAGTRGASIGLREEGNMLTLSLELDYNASFKDFKERLEDFVSVIAFWRNEALNHQ